MAYFLQVKMSHQLKIYPVVSFEDHICFVIYLNFNATQILQDVEYYKTTLREEVEQWLKQLEKAGITDWMIVLVETYDIRKTNKLLPRTTVLDKIKGDFGVKQTEDKFISVINPIKSEARSAESWRSLVAKIRHFILVAYNKALIKFEDYMREQREKRNDPEWDFCKYFIIQVSFYSIYEDLLQYYNTMNEKIALIYSVIILSNMELTFCF